MWLNLNFFNILTEILSKADTFFGKGARHIQVSNLKSAKKQRFSHGFAKTS